MRHTRQSAGQFYFTTTPMPCPYFNDRLERRLVTELVGRNAENLHNTLTHAGFRRSHGISYAPCCMDCDACKSVRVLAGSFNPSRTQRRVIKRNAGLTAVVTSAIATEEQYALFANYQHSRHGDGDMAGMEFTDYQALIEETPIESEVVEFRDEEEKLVAACLTDRVSDGLSAVYSFYDSDIDPKRSIGAYIILWLIDYAKQLGLPYVYLGFWIKDCDKMAYKSGYKPLQVFTPQGWETLKA
ncbi:MAG: arginyltransferase [Rhodospirillaceae bacterium]|jgi:leucyl-tRNA---protein transferase|nr:arginyltransferase [Rhodospirillaceae bacterium]MBT4463917.1 arginyltransferase [Rhodospirillaceae bacterium]MBT5014678.1 arginyltransferase [Rhodospirillaceae bacterium]MBT6407653.1 arginyltransferase [Rhodospirillaceae bacterium]MBT7354779.1 arginyltransferase [Rhodospirillaceae bacterium]